MSQALPRLIKKIDVLEFEIREHPPILPVKPVYEYYVPVKLYTVTFNDGEKRRYLVSDVGRPVVTKEDEDVGFWVDSCATYKCLSNMYWYVSEKWITKHGSMPLDEKDKAFVDWVYA